MTDNKRVATPDPVQVRCKVCRLMPARCRCNRAVPGVLPDPVIPSSAADEPVRAVRKAKPVASFAREPMPDVQPQIAGLVLPDDVLMLAQAAAGDGDLVEWLCDLVRDAVTPKAVSIVDKRPGRDDSCVPDKSTASRTAADRKRAYRERQGEALRAAEAERKRIARAATKPVAQSDEDGRVE